MSIEADSTWRKKPSRSRRSSWIDFSVIAARLGSSAGRLFSSQRVAGEPVPGVGPAISGANCVVMLPVLKSPSSGLRLTLLTPARPAASVT